MKRAVLTCAVAFFGLSLHAAAQSLPELFGKAKTEIKASEWAKALATLDTLDAEAQKPGNEAARSQLAAPLAFYRGVCTANLDRKDDAAENFGAFLKLSPGATIDTATYSKKAVAAFEKAQKDASTRSASLAAAYKEFQPPADAKDRDPVDEYWGNGPVRWIMSDAEEAAWAGLKEPNARLEFADAFWVKRAALPGSDGRTFRQEFDRRVAFADAMLAVSDEARGSLSDRGMVFVLMGPPTYAGRKSLGSGGDVSENAGLSTAGSQDAANAARGAWSKAPSGKPTSAQINIATVPHTGPGKKAVDSSDPKVEVWHYRRELLPAGAPYQQVDFEFVTKPGYGVNVLQRESETVQTLGAAANAGGAK